MPMVFSSLPFFFLILPLFLVLDGLARSIRSVRVRNLVLLFISLLFYIWGESTNVFILLGLGLVNYLGALPMPTFGRKKLLVGLLIVINLGVLIGYKYAAWAISLVIPGLSFSNAMPLGISFFTFHAISYVMDVYRGHIKPARSALDFLTYFCMFPHLVAGPIVRYAQVREDLHRRGPDKILFSFGMYRFLIGLNKKVIIANNVSVVADTAFTLSANGGIGCPDAWIGITAYAIQIYFDFSAYSDMAIGLAAMAGFRFEENFTRPYSSKSIREFWRRWHISLSSWLKDYLYIPLGGNRQGKAATYRNLVLVFLLCGLWHGAEFTFIIWGLWHGLFLVIERMAPDSIGRLAPAFVGRLYAFVVVLIGWVFFRADNTGLALQYLGDMFSFNFVAPDLSYHTVGCLTLGVGVLSCLIPDRFLPAPASRNPDAFPVPFFVFQIVLAAASIALLLTGARNPFIYFNF